MARGSASRRRRDRHHWDKVSALIMGIVGARALPRRGKPVFESESKDDNLVLFPTWDSWDAYQTSVSQDKARQSGVHKKRKTWYRKGPKWK